MSAAILFLIQSALIPPQADLEFMRSIAASQSRIVQQEQRAIRAHVELAVDPNGRIYACKPLAIDGGEASALEICEIAKRHRTKPARWLDGERAYGVFEVTLRFSTPQIDRRNPAESRPLHDIVTVSVPEMPPGLRNPYMVDVNVARSSEGRVVACTGSRDDVDERFVAVACGLVREREAGVLEDRDGGAVNYVRRHSFLFSSNGSASPRAVTVPTSQGTPRT